MANKDLKYFMRAEAKEEIIVEVEGLDSIKDENGKAVHFRIKKLHKDTIDKINKMYTSKVPAKDRKGNYIIQNGEIVYRTEKDNAKSLAHLITEALVYPDLKDTDLMAYYNCVDIAEMPSKVFPTTAEYAAVVNKVLTVLEIMDPDEAEQKEVEAAKN